MILFFGRESFNPVGDSLTRPDLHLCPRRNDHAVPTPCNAHYTKGRRTTNLTENLCTEDSTRMLKKKKKRLGVKNTGPILASVWHFIWGWISLLKEGSSKVKQLPQNKLNLKKACLEGWQISCFLKRAQRTEAFRGQSADTGTIKTQVLEKQLPAALGEEAGLPVRQAASLQRGSEKAARSTVRQFTQLKMTVGPSVSVQKCRIPTRKARPSSRETQHMCHSSFTLHAAGDSKCKEDPAPVILPPNSKTPRAAVATSGPNPTLCA